MPDVPNQHSPKKPPPKVDRRHFFRNGLRELLRPVVESIDGKLAQLKDVLPPELPTRAPVPLQFLRPPGALVEAGFLSQCSCCGDCVRACPADAIRIVPHIADSAPFIDANAAPCVVCTTLECMTVCPTGALVPTPIKFIDMGTAQWNPSTCLRPRGDDCRICVDECPIGEVAISLDETGAVRVHEDGCVGCGVCQHRCPTTPKSIVVEPKSMRVSLN
jgi:MauM/NapG family ferredoxin protein